MTDEETRKLNEKLARWLFPPPVFRVKKVDLGINGKFGHIDIEAEYTQTAKDYINSQEPGLGGFKEVGVYYHWQLLPILTSSFDTCIEHLAPKLRNSAGYVDINLRDFHPEMGDPYLFTIRRTIGYPKMKTWQGGAEIPALAFCLAVEKMIDEGGA